MDNSGCLRRLLNYPPVEDVTIFITSALNLADPTRASALNEKNKPKPKPEPVSANLGELFVPNSDNAAASPVPTNPMVWLFPSLCDELTGIGTDNY